ncbi:MAG: arylsulfatase [Planctomycetota bacterium]|nr:MAG: arylsulfatase [Planctomycetota bacterium]
MDKPNIVLIHVDQWRADCLSILGHPVVHTPYLDQLATQGVLFTNAYCATPSCIASRASLMTGLTQTSHGRIGYKDGVPWDYKTTLAGEFTKGGYQTQAVGKMHVYPNRNRIGFENVILHDGFLHFARKNGQYGLYDDYSAWLEEQTSYKAGYFDHGISCNSYVARPWDKEEYLHPTNYVTSQSIDFLRKRDPTKPFFLYMSYHRPHPPYDPPSWAFDQYINEDMPEPNVGDWSDKFAYLRNEHSPVAIYDEVDSRTLKRAKAGYYGHMTHIDHQINRFVESLKEYDVDKNTYIVFTSDHGELMGDHNFFRKMVPFEGSAKVPLIISGPIDSKIKRRSQCNELIEMRDIMPTLLDCAGLEIPDVVEGKSLLANAKGAENHLRDYIHGEHTAGPQSSFQWIRSKQYKYLWESGLGIECLFDLEKDPKELNDLSDQKEFSDIFSNHQQLLINELEDRKEGFVKNKKLVTGVNTSPVLFE